MFRTILNRLNIRFSDNIQKDGSYCLNFRIPDEILKFNIKGLDWKLLNCSKQQVRIIEESYIQTDGYKPGNTTMIFTSKESEKDILQALFSLNGYKSTVYERIGHGFSKKLSYQVSVTKDKNLLLLSPSKHTIRIKPDKNITWCVETELGNFICRRNGKVHITGNSHNTLDKDGVEWGKSMDVGIDAAFHRFGVYTPFSFEEIKDIMSERDTKIIDHHNKYTN